MLQYIAGLIRQCLIQLIDGLAYLILPSQDNSQSIASLCVIRFMSDRRPQKNNSFIKILLTYEDVGYIILGESIPRTKMKGLSVVFQGFIFPAAG